VRRLECNRHDAAVSAKWREIPAEEGVFCQEGEKATGFPAQLGGQENTGTIAAAAQAGKEKKTERGRGGGISEWKKEGVCSKRKKKKQICFRPYSNAFQNGKRPGMGAPSYIKAEKSRSRSKAGKLRDTAFWAGEGKNQQSSRREQGKH